MLLSGSIITTGQGFVLEPFPAPSEATYFPSQSLQRMDATGSLLATGNLTSSIPLPPPCLPRSYPRSRDLISLFVTSYTS